MKCLDSINGRTSVYGVIGYPVSHSFSPVIHNTLAQLLGHNIVYVPFEVKPEEIKQAILGAYHLGIKGINITVPHKQRVIDCLSSIDSFAEQIGAVNTLKYENNGYKGYNTDLYGLKTCLEEKGIELKDKNVVLLGAGGAAKSAAIMVASENAKSLCIVNRTVNNSYSLAQNVKKYYNVHIDTLSYNEINKIDTIDLCIQTTPVGMSPNIKDTPINDKNFYKKVHVALDIIFNPWQTRFLSEAEEAGCQTINGFDMLYFQAVRAYEIWWDIKIPDNIKVQAKHILKSFYKSQ